MFYRLTVMLMLAAYCGHAETSLVAITNGTATNRQEQAESFRAAQRAEQVRTRCIEGRRYVAGRVLQILPDGLIVDSGYSKLLSAPFNKSWLVTGTASVTREPNAVEENKPDAVCIGLIFLSNIPKRPTVKPYDYVVMHGYPAGDYSYSPVPGVQKTIRRFSASLDRAVQIMAERESK